MTRLLWRVPVFACIAAALASVSSPPVRGQSAESLAGEAQRRALVDGALFSAGHPMDPAGVRAGMFSFGHPFEPADPLLQPGKRRLLLYSVGHPMPRKPDDQSALQPEDRDDYVSAAHAGFPPNGFHYSYDLETTRALLADATPKIVVFHGRWPETDTAVTVYRLVENVPVFVAPNSPLTDLSVAGLAAMMRGADAGGMRMLAPDSTTRQTALVQALAASGVPATRMSFQSVSPYYRATAEAVAGDPATLGFGLRGDAIGRTGLRRVTIEGIDPLDASRAADYPLKGALSVLTRTDYGAEGERLLARYLDLVASRAAEDAYLRR